MSDLTPVKAIRLKCLDCSCYQVKEVRNCDLQDCFLYEYRMGKRPKSGRKWTPIKAIRQKCLDCCLGQRNEVKLCPAVDCSLYDYRLGKNPRRARTYAKDSPILEKTYS